MIGDNDLAVLINHRDAVASLEGYYVRIWDRVLRALAQGVARPGALRVRQLLAELRYLMALLNPNGDTYVRRWIRAWAKQGLDLGSRTAQVQIQAQQADAPEDRKGAVGAIVGASQMASATSLSNIMGMMDARLAGLNAKMMGALSFLVRRTQYVLTHDQQLRDGTYSGLLRSARGRDIAGDLSNVILRGARAQAVQRLKQNGFPAELIDTFDRMSKGQVYSAGGRAWTVESKIHEAASGMISDAAVSGAKITAQSNEVDHVRISNPPRVGEPDVCTVFAGQVFYIGAGLDPLGFPGLHTVPSGGPKFHPHCRHSIQPYVVRLKTTGELAAALTAVQAIPAEFFGAKPYDVTKAVRKQAPSAVSSVARGPRKDKVA